MGTNALTKLNKARIQIINIYIKKKSNKVDSTFTFHGNNNYYSIHVRYDIYDLSLREKKIFYL